MGTKLCVRVRQNRKKREREEETKVGSAYKIEWLLGWMGGKGKVYRNRKKKRAKSVKAVESQSTLVAWVWCSRVVPGVAGHDKWMSPPRRGDKTREDKGQVTHPSIHQSIAGVWVLGWSVLRKSNW